MADAEEGEEESKKDKKEKIVSGKWAAEVYDIFRLFSRTGETFFGLLLLEFGWVLLVLLLGKLPHKEDELPRISLLWFPSQWRTADSIAVHELFIPGALIIFVGWLVFSGFTSYILWFLRRPLRSLIVYLLYAVGFFIFFSLMLFELPFDLIRTNRWIARLTPEERSKIVSEKLNQTKLGGQKISLILEAIKDSKRRKLRKFEKQYGHDIIEAARGWSKLDDAKKTALIEAVGSKDVEAASGNALMEAALEKKTALSEGVGKLLELFFSGIRFIKSRGLIAFAPLKSFNYAEDLNAGKAPAQVFSVATERVRWKFEKLKRTKLVHFINLPLHWVPTNTNEASRLRRAVGADALLWGTYFSDDPNRIWLNIEHWRKPPERYETDREVTVPDLFPYFMDFQSSIVINQTNLRDSYVAVIMAVIHVLKTRSESRRRTSWLQLPAIVSKAVETFRYLDDLSFGGLEIDKVVELVVLDAFVSMPMTSTEAGDSMYPSAEMILVNLASEWVGREIGQNDSYRPAEAVDRLQPVLEKCILLNPSKAENYYRLGALECMRGRAEEALNAFSRAKPFDQTNAMFWSYAEARAKMALSDWDRNYKDMALVRYAAECARAINLGDDKSRTRLSEEFEKVVRVQVIRLSKDETPEIVKIIDRLFAAPAPTSDAGLASGEIPT
jgi:hypothetical protein